MKGLNELFIVGWMLFGIYIELFVMILADLWSGIRKAKMRGEIRSSYGYRKTINKVARYYNALIALTVIDAMQLGGVWYLDNYYECKIPIFPIVTLVGAIGMSLVEIRSIYEKSDEKVKEDYKGLATLVAEIAKHKSDPAEMVEAFEEYMNEHTDKVKEVKDESAD